MLKNAYDTTASVEIESARISQAVIDVRRFVLKVLKGVEMSAEVCCF